MRARVKLIVPLAAGVLALAAPNAPALTPVLTNPVAKLVSCDAKAGVATYRGSMEQIPGVDRMWMRFVLYERKAGRDVRIEAPVLKAWRKSRSGVRKFAYNQTVKGLKAGHVYRAKVRFRWYDASDKWLHSDERSAPVCSLAGDTNVNIVDVAPRPGPSPGIAAYTVTLENDGATDLEGVVTQLVIDGAELDAREIPKLRRGETRSIVFSGPLCHKGIRAVVDPLNVIQESDELDNTFKLPCAG